MLFKRIFATFLMIASLGITATQATTLPADKNPAQSILHILDYVAVDYPATVKKGKVINRAEYNEQIEFTRRLKPLLAMLPQNDVNSKLQAMTDKLIQAIEQRAEGKRIRTLSMQLSTQLISAHRIVTTPRKTISIKEGARLFTNNCTSCHGAAGFGDGVAAAKLDPAPTNFHDRERQGQRSPYSLFITITLGVDGTAMSSYASLSEQQRWNLAFYLSTLYHTQNELQQGQRLWQSGQAVGIINSTKELSSVTPDEIRNRHGEQGVAVLAYLRNNPALLDTGKKPPLKVSEEKLQQSINAYQQGRQQQAYELAVNAYLEGFELAEAALVHAAPELKNTIEREMGLLRAEIKAGKDVQSVTLHANEIKLLMQEAGNKLANTELSSGMAFFSALLILLREGLEAILVLAAIMAFLAKTERKDVMPYMHAGWIGALALGFITWLVAEYLFDFSGSNRELTEGFTGLFAAAMLVYVGFWLHNHTHADKWRAFIHSKLHGVTSGTVWSLTIISFVAVYREVLETVLFYKTLWLQTTVDGHSAILLGLLVSVILLILVAWAIFRFSVRLPISLFFRINSTLLYVMAVVFAGNGIAALQEAGVVSMSIINFPKISLLGVYPTQESLGLQLALILLAVAWLGYERIKKA